MLRFLFAGVLLVICKVGYAQEEELLPDSSSLAVELRLQLFVDDLNYIEEDSRISLQFHDLSQLQLSLVNAYEWRINQVEAKFQAFSSRWNTYFVAQQYEIAAREDLMDRVAELDVLKQAVADSLEVRKQVCAALRDFCEAEAFIMRQDSAYRRMYSRASKLSLIGKTAPLLEKLKASEQLRFAKIEESYGKVKTAVELVPALSSRAAVIDEQYITLKAMSEKITAMAYKPFIQRIKDYLLGFAAVAIILLFFNLMISKFSAIRKTYKSMQQYKKLMKSNESGNYPTI